VYVKKKYYLCTENSIMMKNIVYIAVSIISIMMSACHRPMHVVKASSEIVMIDSTLDAIHDVNYIASMAPIKADLEAQLGAPIGYAPMGLEVHQPECTMLNWASDALLAIARQKCPEAVDVAIVNIGGMRCNWAAGDITFRNVFELMPFDNMLVVLTLKGNDLQQLSEIFAYSGGQGIAGMRIKAVGDKVMQQEAVVTINGKPLEMDKTYTVATSDYLSQGNDGMLPLKNYIQCWNSEEKIRDLYIEYIKEVKIVEAQVDGRMDI
jgi:2',3'-cyclic-nucleotide 2'-phosphodiesterase (5'-nucleotidase family)